MLNPLKWFRRGNSGSSKTIAASYDAAQTTRHNENHWGAADSLSANAANAPGVRRTLRNRSRYEIANNSTAYGITRTLADHTIGVGPRLQILTKNKDLNERLEALWKQWAQETNYYGKLWTLKRTEIVDGEGFMLEIGNPSIRGPIKLDYQLIEADFVTSLRPVWGPWQVDGITYDPQWNPLSYQVVTQRPNDVVPIVWPQQHKVDAGYMIHYYRQDRPGQGRGVPALTSALELFAVWRRYRMATVAAAEVAASFAAFIKSQGPAQAPAASADEWLTLDIQRNLITMLPDGYDISQLKPEQPTSVFESFDRAMLNGISRCLSMPHGIAACDSSGYNYSSGRLDHLTYFRAIEIDQQQIDHRVNERVFRHWSIEALEYLGEPLDTVLEHEWHWPRPLSIDPEKDAAAGLARVRNGQSSLTDEQRQGNVGGDVIRENAQYFGVGEQEIKDRLLNNIFGPLPQSPEESAPPSDKATNRLADIKASADLEFKATTDSSLMIVAAGTGDKLPTFEMLAYSGGKLKLPNHSVPVVVDLATAKVANTTATPILYGHDQDEPVGHATVSISAVSIEAEGVFSGVGAKRDKIVAAGKQNYPWQASIGGNAERYDFVPEGESQVVNGQMFTGPFKIARGFALREISICSVGADANTSTSVAASMKASDMDGYEDWVRSMGFDPAQLTEQQKQSLQNEWQSKQTNTQASAEDDEKKDEASADGSDDDKKEDDDKKTEAKAVMGIQAKGGDGASVDDSIIRARKAYGVESRRISGIEKVTSKNLEIRAKAIEEGWTPEKAELEVIRASRPKAMPIAPGGGGGAPAHDAVIECALLARSGVGLDTLKKLDYRYTDDVLHASTDRRVRSIGLQGLIGHCLQARGVHAGPSFNDDTIRAALELSSSDIRAGGNLDIQAAGDGFASVSLPGILSNLANKSLLAAFFAVPVTSDKFCGTQDLNDFKQATRYRFSMNGSLEKLGPAGEIKQKTVGEESWTNQLNTYANMLVLTRQMMINDDLGALTDLTKFFGRGAALALEEAVFTLLLSNPSSFFAAGNNNLSTGSTASALGVDGLTAAVTKFLKQTDKAGKPIVLNPAVLLVPSELKVLAEQLYTTTNIITIFGAASGTGKTVPSNNPHANKYVPYSSPYLSNSAISGYSTTGWYLLADPADVPMMSIGYLKGQRSPVIEGAQTDLDTLGFKWRCYFDFGVGMVDYRAGVLSTGA